MARVVSKEEAIARLQRQIDAIPALKRLRSGDPAFKKWRRDTEIAITQKGTGHHSTRKCLISFELGFDSSHGKGWTGR